MHVKFEIRKGSHCPHCQDGYIIIRQGRFGDFYACSGFPRCGFTQPIDSPTSNLDQKADDFLKSHGVEVKKI